jgi:hypothetical protein
MDPAAPYCLRTPGVKRQAQSLDTDRATHLDNVQVKPAATTYATKASLAILTPTPLPPAGVSPWGHHCATSLYLACLPVSCLALTPAPDLRGHHPGSHRPPIASPSALRMKFYLDEVATRLRAKGIDAAAASKLLDRDQFQYPAGEARCLVIRNVRHFIILAEDPIRRQECRDYPQFP